MGVEVFGDQLRRLRIAAGKTQEGLAEAAGLSARGISDLERGLKQRPHRSTVKMLADALDLTPEARLLFQAAAIPSLAFSPTTLPQSLTPLIGRDHDVAAVTRLVQPDSGHRLVTLTGPGGVGKTRLALQVVNDLLPGYPGTTAFVELAGLANPRFVLPAMMSALGIRDRSGREPLDVLMQQIHDRQVLVVLDNLEHLLKAAPEIGALLVRCRGLTLLVTSRAALHLTGEWEYPVRPLALPDPDHSLDMGVIASSPAVRLFVHQAQAVQPHFMLTDTNATAIAGICASVDGLPLALELAAVRIKALSPNGLASLLAHRLDLLDDGSRNLPAHQQTMRSTIAWSYDLLGGDEREAFCRLSVFESGITSEAAEAALAPGDPIATLNLLSSLLDQSLIHRGDTVHGHPRFMMLATVRDFAREQLALSGDERSTQERHALWCRDLAVLAESKLVRKVDPSWLEVIEAEYNNLRAALAWSLAAPGHAPAVGLRIASALWLFWYYHVHLSEGRHWLTLALDATGRPESSETVMAMTGLGMLAHAQGDDTDASSLLDDAYAMAQRIDDPWTAAFALSVRGNLAEDRGDYSAAATAFSEANRLFAEQDDLINVGVTRYHLGVVAYGQGDLDAALELCQSAADLCRRSACPWCTANALGFLGLVYIASDDPGSAASPLVDALNLFEQVGSTARTLEIVRRAAVYAHATRQPEIAVRWLAAASALGSRIGAVVSLPESRDYERVLHEASPMLTDWSRASAWEEGMHLSLEEVVAEVRDTLIAPGIRYGGRHLYPEE